jgi:ribosomal protein S18 acetylase RimI-like enzyme
MGVASSLIGLAKRFAMETNAARLVLATAINNQPAQTLYERFGWKRDDDFIHFKHDL